MRIAYIVFMLLAFACFLVSAGNIPQPPRWNTVALGLMFWTLAEMTRTFLP